MNIETKYNAHDKVSVVSENKVKQLEIFIIKIRIGREVSIKYELIPEKDIDKRKFMEDECFSTREEALDSLIK